MKWINKIVNFFSAKQYLLYLLLFIIAVSLFTYLGSNNTFADPDAFYHAKMAEILAQRGAITEFPWLSATSLKYSFVDHHFLYHLALIPFVQIFSPLIGLKIASIIFSALTIVFIFWFLKQLKIKGAFWYALFLLTINPFIFRLNLGKAQPLVLIFLFLFIYLMFYRRYLSLLLLSCFYVWLYGGWPIIFVLIILYGGINWFWPLNKRSWWLFNQGKSKIFWQNILIFISAGLGILAGIFFSPYFPQNLSFYWQQSFKIAVVNYQNLIGVGGEWYPYPPVDLFLVAIQFFIFFIFAILVFLYFLKKQPMNSWFLLVLSLIFLLLTLKSRRYVEYFVPVAFCFSALSINTLVVAKEKVWEKLMPKNLFSLIPVVLL
ncbi:MAG: hypothetical protein NTX98_02055, partial [Candidatus Doudnabacteria bacterium]|nr:hypothetical protein [Candidatus Doudnabacteria bacterium]